jgi:hypothetical protein
MKGVDKYVQNSILFPKKGKVKGDLKKDAGSRSNATGKLTVVWDEPPSQNCLETPTLREVGIAGFGHYRFGMRVLTGMPYES